MAEKPEREEEDAEEEEKEEEPDEPEPEIGPPLLTPLSEDAGESLTWDGCQFCFFHEQTHLMDMFWYFRG